MPSQEALYYIGVGAGDKATLNSQRPVALTRTVVSVILGACEQAEVGHAAVKPTSIPPLIGHGGRIFGCHSQRLIVQSL